MKDFSKFEAKIGYTFKDKQLLKQAFLHRSYLNEHPKEPLGHNERLEFLGDAVLELVTTSYLFRKYTEKPEGELTAYRASLVNTGSISGAAQELGMNDYLLLSKGEAKDTGKAREYILANTFEAFIGSLYLDGGYDIAYAFIEKNLFPHLEGILREGSWQDSKSKFQEKAQEHEGVTPAYSLLDETGPDHDKNFVVGAYLGEELIAKGDGRSKQQAEQQAALHALKEKGWNN